MAITNFHYISDTAGASTFTTTWVTDATDAIELGFQGFLQGIDYVQEKIKTIFDDRAKIKQYRKDIFTDKIKQSFRIIKKQSYTVMIPPKRNFKGKESQRK